MAVQPRVSWFDEVTRAKIAEEAVTVLEKVGVFVENEEALALLDGAGTGQRPALPAQPRRDGCLRSRALRGRTKRCEETIRCSCWV